MGKVEHGTQEEYIKGWTDTMVDIWKEKIIKYSIINKGGNMAKQKNEKVVQTNETKKKNVNKKSYYKKLIINKKRII